MGMAVCSISWVVSMSNFATVNTISWKVLGNEDGDLCFKEIVACRSKGNGPACTKGARYGLMLFVALLGVCFGFDDLVANGTTSSFHWLSLAFTILNNVDRHFHLAVFDRTAEMKLLISSTVRTCCNSLRQEHIETIAIGLEAISIRFLLDAKGIATRSKDATSKLLALLLGARTLLGWRPFRRQVGTILRKHSLVLHQRGRLWALYIGGRRDLDGGFHQAKGRQHLFRRWFVGRLILTHSHCNL